jgi:pimeloyl-ACP methyl ester carboxylesterase
VNDLTIDGATVSWTDSGSGEPTLLIHAGVFGAWFDRLPALPGRTIRMRRAGYTDTPPPTRPITIAEHAAHAAAVLDTLTTGPATVVAHSSGCLIALQLAHERPDLVARLVLGEPPLIDPLLDPVDAPAVGATLGPAMGAAMAATAAGDTTAAFTAFMTAVCGPRHRAVLTETLGPDGLARAERESVFFFTNEAPAAGGWTPVDLTTIASPTLLVQGGASPGPTHRLVARMVAQLPDAAAATIDGADHLLPLTHPRELADLIATRRTARGSLAGRLQLTGDWDDPAVNDAIARDFAAD